MNSTNQIAFPNSHRGMHFVQQSRLAHLHFLQGTLAMLAPVSLDPEIRKPPATFMPHLPQMVSIPEPAPIDRQASAGSFAGDTAPPLASPSRPSPVTRPSAVSDVVEKSVAMNTLLYQAPIETQGLESLEGSVLVIADVENLSYGLHHEGHDFNFNRFLQLVNAHAKTVHAHAFSTTTSPASLEKSSAYFQRMGWEPHLRLATTKHSRTGQPVRQANSDNQILLYAGSLANSAHPDLIILATGDGDLACSLAGFFKSNDHPPQVVTASLAGATSRRLYAGVNPHIDNNIVLGRDCILPKKSQAANKAFSITH